MNTGLEEFTLTAIKSWEISQVNSCGWSPKILSLSGDTSQYAHSPITSFLLVRNILLALAGN
jgi:hypothetical protein